MKRYENIRPQLADATLLYLADRDGIDTIFTLDQRDFSGASLPAKPSEANHFLLSLREAVSNGHG